MMFWFRLVSFYHDVFQSAQSVDGYLKAAENEYYNRADLKSGNWYLKVLNIAKLRPIQLGAELVVFLFNPAI